MREPRLERDGTSGDLWLRSLEPPFVRVLQALPGMLRLAEEHPEARARLRPDAYEESALAEEWRRHGVPEIERLFATARDLVAADLARLEREGFSRTFRLRIPAAHHTAWMSSLNAARLAIGEVYRIRDEDLAPGRAFDPGSERDSALLDLSLLGWLQELLVDAA